MTRREAREQAQARERRKLGDVIALQSYQESDDLPLERSALRHLCAEFWEVIGLGVPETVGQAREIAEVLRAEGEARRARPLHLRG